MFSTQNHYLECLINLNILSQNIQLANNTWDFKWDFKWDLKYEIGNLTVELGIETC